MNKTGWIILIVCLSLLFCLCCGILLGRRMTSNLYVDDPRMDNLFSHCEEVGLPVLFHMGDARYAHSAPKKLAAVCEALPELRCIAAHFGGYTMHEIAKEELKGKDCFFDVSSSLMFMEEGVAEGYITHYGAERFVYGSDFPMWDPVVEMERFMRLKLTDSQKEQIAHITAERILKI